MDFSAAKEYIVERLVKELSKDLYYHGAHHTFSVVKSAQYLGKQEGVSNEEMLVLLTAAYYHDAGFLFAYHANEDLAISLVKEMLPQFGYSETAVSEIVRIIEATKPGIKPQTLLEEIMCDADHDYFGRDDYGKIAEELRKELEIYEGPIGGQRWIERQIEYLSEKHVYYTKTSLKIREIKKLQNIEGLRKALEGK